MAIVINNQFSLPMALSTQKEPKQPKHPALRGKPRTKRKSKVVPERLGQEYIDRLVRALELKHIKCVVPVSGGKDSQACLKMAVEEYGAQSVIGLFCDTMWESPETYKHLDFQSSYYNVEIAKICVGSVENEVLRRGDYPAGNARFCTNALKIQPAKKFYESLAARLGHGFEVWYGMRSEESTERKKRYSSFLSSELYAPHEINKAYPKRMSKSGIIFRLPILDFSEAQVFELLEGKENPLYKKGARRVGCYPCLMSTAQDHKNVFLSGAFGLEQKEKIIRLEKLIGKKHTPANIDQLCMICQI